MRSYNNLEIHDWIKEKDILFNNFNIIASKLEIYFKNEIKESKKAESIALNLRDTISRCNEIEFNSPYVADAYVFWHFLIRYYKTQIILCKMLELDILPLSQRVRRVLSVGCGPAPELFAISDFFQSIKKFGELTKNEFLKNIEFNLDYVEKSQEFRNWLHKFTEYLNFKQEIISKVPYHHGSFFDLEGIQIPRLGYSFVLYQYFFTTISKVSQHQEDFLTIARKINPHGIFLITGAQSDLFVYKKIYSVLKSLISAQRVYKYHKNYLRRLRFNMYYHTKMEFNPNNRFIKRIKEFYLNIYTNYEENKFITFIPNDIKKEIKKWINSNKPIKCEVYIYKNKIEKTIKKNSNE